MSQAAPVAASTPGASLLPDSTGMFTAAHLIWIVLFALAAIAVICWGVHLKRRRRSAERKVEAHNAQLLDQPPAIPPAAAAPPVAAPTMPPLPYVEPDVVPLGPTPFPVEVGPAGGPVTQLKGLGPRVAERLAEFGITSVGQLAALNDDEAAELDGRLGTFSGRMGRDRWLEQARFLAAGDRAGFESVFGRL